MKRTVLTLIGTAALVGLAVQPATATVHEITGMFCSEHGNPFPAGLSDPTRREVRKWSGQNMVPVLVTDDEEVIVGSGKIATEHDHRIAMSFAVAALRASGPITILDTAVVDTSFPGFVGLARNAGLGIEETLA